MMSGTEDQSRVRNRGSGSPIERIVLVMRTVCDLRITSPHRLTGNDAAQLTSVDPRFAKRALSLLRFSLSAHIDTMFPPEVPEIFFSDIEPLPEIGGPSDLRFWTKGTRQEGFRFNIQNCRAQLGDRRMSLQPSEEQGHG